MTIFYMVSVADVNHFVIEPNTTYFNNFSRKEKVCPSQTITQTDFSSLAISISHLTDK